MSQLSPGFGLAACDCKTLRLWNPCSFPAFPRRAGRLDGQEGRQKARASRGDASRSNPNWKSSSLRQIAAGMPAAMVTRSRSSRQNGHSRLARGEPPSLWPRLPAELLGRIAAACESGATLRAIDAVDRSLWSTRVERLLGALQGTPSEPLLLHVRHVARRAAPALVTAGALHPSLPTHLPRPAHATPRTPHHLRRIS